MDIFSQPKQRTQSDIAFKYQLQSEPDPSKDIFLVINQDIKERFAEESLKFERFIKQKYAEMDYKINRCTYNCYASAESYAKMKSCKTECTAVERKFPKFIEDRTSQMNELLNECLDKHKHGNQTEVFRCYDLYIRGFQPLKLKIQQESRFYQ